MCPQASGAGAKYAYLDHDTDVVEESPPILNQWYTVFDAEDVRLLWCVINQYNDEVEIKGIEVRWTIDGNVYYYQFGVDDGAMQWVYRNYDPSPGGGEGLRSSVADVNAAYYVDKRGHSFKVEVRIVTALGTNQFLGCYCVRETLEQT